MTDGLIIITPASIAAMLAGEDFPKTVKAGAIGHGLCVHRAVYTNGWSVSCAHTGLYLVTCVSRRNAVRAAWRRMKLKARERYCTVDDLLALARSQAVEAGIAREQVRA